jgi:hypothetical protein
VRTAHDAGVNELDDALAVATGWIETFIEANRQELAALARWYTIACLAVGLEIVLWLLNTPGTLG